MLKDEFEKQNPLKKEKKITRVNSRNLSNLNHVGIDQI